MSSQTLPKTVEMPTDEVTQRDATIKALRLTIEKLKIELTHLKRMRYGRSSEKMDAAQTQLELLSAALAPLLPLGTPLDAVGDAKASNVSYLEGERDKRRNKSAYPQHSGLPEHLPREDVVHSACATDCKCSACGTGLQKIGQDVSEVLDYEPGSFKVIRHIRPKFACSQCLAVTQALAPSRPMDRCMAGAGLIARVMVSKYADHCPLYRQSQIYAREDVLIAGSTMGGWMGSGAALLTPLAQAIGRYVLQAYKVHSDDTPTRTLGAVKGKAHLGRIWAYVRDDRSWGDGAHPAVWFQYSEDRRGEHPRQHLGNTWASSAVCCRSMPSQATTRSLMTPASWKLHAGRTRDANTSKSTSSRTLYLEPWHIRHCKRLPGCMRWNSRFEGTALSCDEVSGNCERARFWRKCTCGYTPRWARSRSNRPWRWPLGTAWEIGGH